MTVKNDSSNGSDGLIALHTSAWRKILRVLNATPEQRAAINRILAGKGTQPKGPEVESFIDKHPLGEVLGKSLRAVDGCMVKGIVSHYKWGRTIAFRWSKVEVNFRVQSRRRTAGHGRRTKRREHSPKDEADGSGINNWWEGF